MKDEDLSMQESTLNAYNIRRKGDDIRKKILDTMNIDVTQTTPNVFNYSVNTNDVGLNEISNVDMGYACSTIDGTTFGKRNPYLKELEHNVALMKDSENAIVVLNGGLFTYIPKTRNGEMLSYEEQVAYFYSLFKDLAQDGKIVAMVRGTEEHRILKNHQVDVLGVLQEALGLSGKVCNDALVNVALQDDKVGEANVGIRTINWNNTATTGAYIGRKMEERATKRGGADIYLARTTMNYFKSAVVGESVNGKKENKPIYMISGGSYTPFKGAMTAGAEYNSIKDGELAPNSFWYRVTVEENNGQFLSSKPYIVRVNPINYVAHQINYQGTDKLTAQIDNMITAKSDNIIQSVVDRYAESRDEARDGAKNRIRETLLNNRKTADTNAEIMEYIAIKKGEKLKEVEEEKTSIKFEGSNVPETMPKTMIDDDSELSDDGDMELD